jgi:hypothetical protein
MVRLAAVAAAAGPGSAIAGAASVCDLRPQELRVDWRSAPVGVGGRRPRFTWTLAAVDPDARNLGQSACRVRVASSAEVLARGEADVWDSGKLPTSKLVAAPDHDLPLKAQSAYVWSVTVWDQAGRASAANPVERFITGMLDGWRAQWIAAEPDGPRESLPPSAIRPKTLDQGARMPLFRREFEVAKTVRAAVVSISGLGQYELTINGRPVTRSLLNPGWTDYRKTILYDTFEVADLLRPGANALGVRLGAGMYNVEGVKGRYTKFVGSFGQPKLIAQLRLLFEDGSEAVMATDASWTTRPGPITFSSTYGGEDYDARLEPKGWMAPVAPADGWSPVLEVAGPGGALKASGIPPITVERLFGPKTVTQPKPGVFVYDLGENFSGVPCLKVRGPAGAKVTLLPGELLDDKGFVSQRSANGHPESPALFCYTLAGEGEESWSPKFSYYGFRYIQVEGAAPAGSAGAGMPELLSLDAAFVHADLPQTGTFDCSDELLVRIHKLIERAVLSNAVSVLTDCPQREKLGWLEQTYLNASTVFYNRDAVTLYEKMVGDISDAQTAYGLVPEIAPEYVGFFNKDGSDGMFRDSPEWGAAVVLAPWAAYRFYGDEQVLADGYPAMRRYADYLNGKLKDGLLSFGLGDWYDTGPKPPGVSQLTTMGVTATATWYEMLKVLVQIARVLGRPPSEAAEYERRAAAAKAAFNARFFHPETSQYDLGSQTANAIALAVGLVPAGHEPAVLDNLIADIRAHSNHVTAGDIGFHYVVRALTEHGRGDVLFDVMSRTDASSYGYQLARGATALTEAWDANPHNSQNHFMLGHGEAWLYGGLCGLRLDLGRNGADAVVIAPQPVKGVGSAAASYRSVLGEVRSAWKKVGGELILDVEVPAGASAQVLVPGRDPAAVHEGGRPLERRRGVRAVQATASGVRVTIGSGRYRFQAPLPAALQA